MNDDQGPAPVDPWGRQPPRPSAQSPAPAGPQQAPAPAPGPPPQYGPWQYGGPAPLAGPPHTPYAPGPRPRHPRAVRLFLISIATSVLTLVWLWLPWTTIGRTDNFGDSKFISTNGFRTVPDDCFTCASTSVSVWGVLLLVACCLAALSGIVWMLSGEPLLGTALRFISVAMLLLTVINGFALYIETVTIVDGDNRYSIYPNMGPAVALITSVITIVCARRVRPFLHV